MLPSPSERQPAPGVASRISANGPVAGAVDEVARLTSPSGANQLRPDAWRRVSADGCFHAGSVRCRTPPMPRTRSSACQSGERLPWRPGSHQLADRRTSACHECDRRRRGPQMRSCTSSRTLCRSRVCAPIEIQRPPLREAGFSGPHPAGLPGRRLRLLARRTHVSNVASGGGTRRRKTARPGPSPAGEWMLSGAEDSLTQLGELLGRTPSRSRCDTPLPTRTATAASSAAPTDGPAGHRSTSQARLATTFRPLRLLRLLRLL